MRTGHILIILACLLPLCACSLTFDELPVIEWEPYRVKSYGRKGDSERISVYFNSTVKVDGSGIQRYYQDFERTQPLNTNKLVYINGNPLPGEGGGY